MGIIKKLVCEVRYQKNKTGKIRSDFGILDESEITHFYDNKKDFIQITNKSSSLIPKHEIKEIVIYQDWDRFIPDHERLKFYHNTERRRGVSMCS